MINHILNYLLIAVAVLLFVTCEVDIKIGSLRIRKLVAWYDLWIGAYWDRKKKELYVFLVPCIGLHISKS